MHQRAFATTILERAGMLDCDAAKTPGNPGMRYTKLDSPPASEHGQRTAERTRYHTLVGSLNFLVSVTRDDMRYSQGKAAKFCQNPGDVHIQSLQHLFRFLKGSIEYGVNFVWSATDAPKLDGPLDIVAWSDSSFADDIDSAKTTLGFVIQVNGSTVAAMSKLSPRVDSCVNHSELGAFDEATAPPDLTDGASISLVKTSRSVVWVRGVKAELERRDERSIAPTRVNVDSAGVLAMLKGITVKAANGHIFRSLAENRERVNDDRSVLPVKVGTADNLANALTKQEAPGTSVKQLLLITGPKQ